MKILIFFMTLLLASCGNTSNSRIYEQSKTKPIEVVCSLVQDQPEFNYDEWFSDEFRLSMNKKDLVRLLSSSSERNGPCRDTKLPHSDLEDRQDIYFIEHSNGRRTVVELRENSAGKISKLQFHGDLPSDAAIGFQEFRPNMTDGAALRTIVFFDRNKGLTASPIVLLRTPYIEMDDMFRYSVYFGMAEYFASEGYHFVLQSIRGKYGSEGEFKFLNPLEVDDGFDSINWLSKQNFSNGKVAVTGTSYDGFTALAAGVRNPSALKVILAGGSPSNAATDGFRYGGPMIMPFLDYLKYQQVEEALPFSESFSEEVIARLLKEPDLTKYDNILYGRDITEWDRFASAYPNHRSDFWKSREIYSRLKEIQVPTWHIAGMKMDGDVPDVLRNFLEVERSKNRRFHRLILGYWDHGNSTPYVANGENLSPFMKDRFLPILGYFLKGEASKYVEEPRVQVESSIDEKFIGAQSYPPMQLKELSLYFASLSGKLSLMATPKLSDRNNSEYSFLPFNLNDMSDGNGQTLNFWMEAKQELALASKVSFDLFVETNSPQTDLLITLRKKNKEGVDQFVSVCLVGATILGPNKIQKIHIESCPVKSKIAPGETLGVSITSNMFPTVIRNRNRSLDGYFDSLDDAKIVLHHSEKFPSKISLKLEQH